MVAMEVVVMGDGKGVVKVALMVVVMIQVVEMGVGTGKGVVSVAGGWC